MSFTHWFAADTIYRAMTRKAAKRRVRKSGFSLRSQHSLFELLASPRGQSHSAPDTDWSWESQQADWVFGYRFYECTAARGEELPLCVGMPTKPWQNDAITGYVCLLQYHRLTGRPLYAVRFDSAHANEPTYRLVRSLRAHPLHRPQPGQHRRRGRAAADQEDGTHLPLRY